MRNSLRPWLVWLLALLLPTLPAAAAGGGLPPQHENRFLFVIDTASAMRRSSNGVVDAVREMLHSGMQGQLQDGDTIGLWTYDDQVHSGFPMQLWNRDQAGEVDDRIIAYIGSLHYQKRAHLDKIMPVVRQVAAASRVLTVIFIFDGEEEMNGTGFDTALNDLHKEFGKQMRRDHVPFVTVLAARDGKFVEYTVNVPGSITIPRTADYVVRQPRPTPTNAIPGIAEMKPVTPPPPPRVAEHHYELILTNSTPAPIASIAPSVTPITPPPQPVAVTPSPEPVAATAPLNPAPPAPEPPPQAPVNNSQAAAQTSSAPVVAASSPVVAPTVPLVTAAGPAPAPVAASAPPAAVAPPAVVALPSPEDHFALLVIALSLLTIAVVLVLFLLRRSRATGSLISQSMDRPR